VTVSDLLQWGTLFVGGVGIGVALINQRRQLNAQMFIEFSKRFEELLRLFPTEAWLANRRPHQELPPCSTEITECTLYCIQFVADVYHLHEAGYISNRLWSLWEREIKRTLRGPLFVREWSAWQPNFRTTKNSWITWADDRLDSHIQFGALRSGGCRIPMRLQWRHFSANRVIDDGGDRPLTRAYRGTVENTARYSRWKTAARLPFLKA
jgi:hypothetical protein